MTCFYFHFQHDIVPGACGHDHPGEPGKDIRIRTKMAIHAEKLANPFKSTRAILVNTIATNLVKAVKLLTLSNKIMQLIILNNTYV